MDAKFLLSGEPASAADDLFDMDRLLLLIIAAALATLIAGLLLLASGTIPLAHAESLIAIGMPALSPRAKGLVGGMFAKGIR